VGAVTSGRLRAVARLRAALGVLRLRATLPLVFGRQGMRELMARLDAGAASPGGGDAARAAELERLVARLSRPLRFWSTTCLWRALAGYATLRAAGDDVRLLIGVRPGAGGELDAHAWLERGGAPSLGAPEPAAGYRVAFAWPADPGTLAPHREADVAGLSPSEDAVLTELRDGTGVLLHLGTRFYFTLNRTGVLVWKLVAGGAPDVATVAAGVAAEFPEIERAAIAADVGALLAEFQSEGLVAERA
jgi:hypothetical protein